MPAHKFIPDKHPAEVKLDALAREVREIMEALRRRDGINVPLSQQKASELASKAQRALMAAGRWP